MLLYSLRSAISAICANFAFLCQCFPTLITIPFRTFGYTFESNALKMKPLPRAIRLVASDHFTVTDTLTIAIPLIVFIDNIVVFFLIPLVSCTDLRSST